MVDSADNSPEVNEPPVFHDAEGRRWTINLTVGTIKKVLERYNVNLLVDGQTKNASSIVGLWFDSGKLVGVLWFLIKKQAAAIIIPADGEPGEEDYSPEHPMKEADLWDAMDADSIMRGWEALREAVLFFTRRNNPSLAAAFERMMETEMKLAEAGVAEMLTVLESQDVNQEMKKIAARIGRDMKIETVRQLGSFATDSQE